MTIGEEGSAQTGADGDDQHDAGKALACTETYFGQTGNISVIRNVNGATGLLGKILRYRIVDEGRVDIRGCAGYPFLDGGRKAHADWFLRPLMLFQNGFQRFTDGLGRCRLGRCRPGSLSEQLASCCVYDGCLDSRSTYIYAQNMHAMTPLEIVPGQC